MNISDFIMHGGEILTAAAQIVAAASVLANFTKTDKDNKALSKIGGFINFLALNWRIKPASATKFNQ